MSQNHPRRESTHTSLRTNDVKPCPGPQHTLAQFGLPFFLGGLVLVSYATTLIWLFMYDFDTSFYPTAGQWLAGHTNLYDKPGVEFYNAPWLLGLVVPLANMPRQQAAIVFTALTLISVVTSIVIVSRNRPLNVVGMAVINPTLMSLIANGQVDALPLLGVCIGYLAVKRNNVALLSASFFIMAIKPYNVILVIALYLFVSREWRALAFPLLAYFASSMFIGFDWPFRVILQLQNSPPPVAPESTIWRAGLPGFMIIGLLVLALLGFVRQVRAEGLGERTLALALATTLTFTPYALLAHYVLLIPGFLFVAQRNLFLAVLAYLTTWVLVVAPPGQPWSAVAYPSTLFALVWVSIVKDRFFPTVAKRFLNTDNPT